VKCSQFVESFVSVLLEIELGSSGEEIVVVVAAEVLNQQSSPRVLS